MPESGSHNKASSVRSSFIYQRCRAALRDAGPVWLALAVLTSLPYILAAVRTPGGHVFSGVLTAYDDTFSYLAWIKQSASGGWLMCDLYTSEPQTCEFFLPLWLLIGKISSVTGAPPVWVFHAARLLASLLLLIAARSVARQVMRSRRRLRMTLWLYAMSGGLGWLVYLLNNSGSLMNASVTSGSVDLNLPEAIAFRSAFAQVHFTLGAALVAWAIRLVFSSLLTCRSNRAIAAGLLVSLLVVVHPYLVVVVFGVVGVSLALWPLLDSQNRKARTAVALRAGLGFGIAATPGITYLLYLNHANEVLREWLRVTDTISPPPVEYAAGFGIVLLLAIFGFKFLWTLRPAAGRLVLIWAAVQSALLYAPVTYQRRFVEGLQLPLCIAASVAVFWLIRKLRLAPRVRSIVLVGLVVVASLTNIGFTIGQLAVREDGPAANDPRRYLSSDLAGALSWLNANAEPDDVVFSAYLTGNIVPASTRLRVYLGHYGQTLSSNEKGARVTAFYRGELSDETARAFLMESRVRYVIDGPFERAIADEPVWPNWLLLAYESGDVRVYKVADPVKDQGTR